MSVSRPSAAAILAAFLIGAHAGLAVAQIAGAASRPPEEAVERIPNVIGKSIDSALVAFELMHLPTVLRDSVTTVVRRGRIVAQRPLGGTLRAGVKAETVWVAVPARPPRVGAHAPSLNSVVPNVLGFTIRDAQRALNNAGISQIAISNVASEAIVVSQSPSAGTLVPPGIEVVLVAELAVMRRPLDSASRPMPPPPTIDSVPTMTRPENQLDSARLTATGLDKMTEGTTSIVRLVLERLRGLRVRDSVGRQLGKLPSFVPGAFTAVTMVSDDVTVCLFGADTGDFRIIADSFPSRGTGACARQTVDQGDPAPWLFRVTPLRYGTRTLEVRVQAWLRGYAPTIGFDETYQVKVAVKDCRGVTECLVNSGNAIEHFVTETTMFVKIIGGLFIALSGMLVAWRVLRRGGREDEIVKAGEGALGTVPKREQTPPAARNSPDGQ